jgi:hypothetical protein
MIAIFAIAVAAPPMNSAFSVQSLHRIGECIAHREPKTAREVLAMDFRSNEYKQKLKAIGTASSSCIPTNSDLQSAGLLFAGAVAEGLLKTEVKKDELPNGLAYDPARDLIEARSPTEEMALCTAFKAPKATAALLQTDPATANEAEAEDSLASTLRDCLKKDAKIELNRPALRSMLALAAYRIVTTPKGVGQ